MTPTWRNCAALAAHERCVASARRGFDFYREGAPRVGSGARVRNPNRARARNRKAADDCTRAADDATLDQLASEADGLSVVIHCFSMPTRPTDCLERGYQSPSPATSLQERRRSGRGRATGPRGSAACGEQQAPYLTPQVVRNERNQPAFVAHAVAFLAQLRGVSRSSSALRWSAMRPACSAGERLVAGTPPRSRHGRAAGPIGRGRMRGPDRVRSDGAGPDPRGRMA